MTAKRRAGAVAAILILSALAGCIPAGRKPPHKGAAFNPDRDLKQCLVDLGDSGARFEILPDRVFGGGCSATGSVKLVSAGIPITNLGAIKCRTAERLTRWMNEAVQSEAKGWLDARVVKIESFGTYACRPVNSKAGAKLSQHGLANAVDIAAFVLDDGRRITVKQDWRGGDARAQGFLRAVFKAGCKRFNIVIGPDGDSFHQDHFHFDMGPNGPYCH